MTERADEIIERIVALAEDDEAEDALLEMTAATTRVELYEGAVAEFGGWDAALVAALRHAVRSGGSGGGSSRSSRPSTRIEEAIERKVTRAAREAIYTFTSDGTIFWIDGPELDVTEEPERLAPPEGAGPMVSMQHMGSPDGVFVFSDRGRYYGLDPRMLPQWMGPSPVKDMAKSLPFEAGERLRHALPRDAMGQGRIIHVTAQGKGKATEASEIGRPLDRSGREAFLLAEGDTPIAVLSAEEGSTVFCASAKGQGIHFEDSDLRSMGRKAMGVNVMKLDGDDDAVVSAFAVSPDSDGEIAQLAVITERGMGKRIWFEEFRTQGRGGAGMQVLRLDAGDRVVAVVPCDPAGDLVVMTSEGRVHRRPADEFELMGRPAKGNRMIDLAEGERVVGLSWLPAGSEN